MGQGAVMSIVALVLYAIMIVLACRLPQDDPYGLCCKRDDSPRSDTGAHGQFGLLGSGKSEISNGTSDQITGNGSNGDSRRERPNWMSEDKDEENEII